MLVRQHLGQFVRRTVHLACSQNRKRQFAQLRCCPRKRPPHRGRGRSGSPAGGSAGGKSRKKADFFFGGRCLCEVRGWGCGSRCATWPSAGLAAGLPQAGVSDREGRGTLRAPTPAGALPGARPAHRGYGGPRAALRSSGRVWLSQTASSLSHLRHPCAGLPPLALREVPIRGLRTPHARKAARGSRRSPLP